MLERSFGSEPRFRLVDLTVAVDLGDRNLCFDGMHLSTDGVQREVTALMAAIGPAFWTADPMTMSAWTRAEWRRLAVFIAVLGTIAVLAPAPWNPTDRDEYERVGREMVDSAAARRCTASASSCPSSSSICPGRRCRSGRPTPS